MCVWGGVVHLSTVTTGQKRITDPPKLELQVLSHPMWALRTERRYSVKQYSFLTMEPSLQVEKYFLQLHCPQDKWACLVFTTTISSYIHELTC